MVNPSYTYTLTNGTTADATQVMQDFNDILNGITDGTKDLSISALTVAGTATLNGNINLGNASADDLTITASLASSIPIKTTNSYDLGSASLGLRKLYFGNSGGSTTVNLSSAASIASSRSYTLPDVAGAGIVLVSLGTKTVSSADYTILDNDGYQAVLVTTGASQRTITLPAVSTNAGRILTIKKIDSGAGTVLIETPSTETIDGAAQNVLNAQLSFVTLNCDGTNWSVLAVWDQMVSQVTVAASSPSLGTFTNVTSLTPSSGTWNGFGTNQISRTSGQSTFETAISVNTGNTTTDHVKSQNYIYITNATINDISQTVGPWKIVLTAATTYYLKFKYDLGAQSTSNIQGTLTFVRVV